MHIKSKLKQVIVALTIISLVGCATPPNKIPAAYVSPLKYKNYDEDQIIMEMDHVGRRTTELYAQLKKKANADKWQMGVGLLLFWPTLFALEGGDGPEAAEYSRLKGEYEALRQAAIQKKINMNSLPASPESIIQEEEKKFKEQSKNKK
tara:strand:- start:213 stop:659 length:447 start_codon:yes stop_codon:yes gene_type:complete